MPFVESPFPSQTPAIALTSSPTAVTQNPQAASTCQWASELVLRETGGFLVQLSSLKSGTTDLSSSLQTLFGTTRLGPFGTLRGTLCLGGSVSGARIYTVAGTSELGTTVTTTATVTYSGPPSATPPALTASPASLTLPIDGATQSSLASVALNFAGGSPDWTVSVSGAPWLTVTPASGTGAGQLSIQAAGAGLSNGVYPAVITIQALNALPQAINIPVTFIVGASSDLKIASVANGASVGGGVAPGTMALINGTQLAPSANSAPYFPLPYSLAGVSATVNGISAPLYSVAPGQLKVQIPYEVGSGPAALAVNNNGKIAYFPVTIKASAPGIFTTADGSLLPSATAKQGQTIVAYVTGEGDLTPSTASGSTPASGTSASRLPKPRLPVTVTVGGLPAAVTFSGLQSGTAGVMQVNFTVPPTAPTGIQLVIVSVGGVQSPPATLTVQ